MYRISRSQPFRLSSQTARSFATAEGGAKVTGPIRGDIRLLTASKLNFGDVLIVPQKSFVHSRSKVDIQTTYDFKYSNF